MENLEFEQPNCFEPEKESDYPLCVGNGLEECNCCNMYKDFGPPKNWFGGEIKEVVGA